MRWMRSASHPSGNHGVDGDIVIFVLLTQARHDEPDFRLFLIRHTIPHDRLQTLSGLLMIFASSYHQIAVTAS
jgi:hypothetical protein